MRHIKHLFLFSFLKQGRAISVKSKKKVFTSRPQTVAHPGFKKGGHNRGSGGETPAPNGFLRFSYKKHSFWHTFFIEKAGRAVSAVTTDNAKIFLQLMSKSRSLAKISERRLQSLLV